LPALALPQVGLAVASRLWRKVGAQIIRGSMAAVVLPPTVQQSVAAGTSGRVSFHIPSLDGLRAASFFVVFLAHAGLDQVPGGFGVTVFFFLSGYLITTLMRVEAETTGRVRLEHFYLRRALRILPPFYIVLVGATALGEAGFLRGDPPPEVWPVVSQILHVSNYWLAFRGWRGIATGTGVYWSLAVEEHFYLLFPAVFLLLGRLRFSGPEKATCFWMACAVVLAWRCALVLLFQTKVDRTYICSDTRVDSILFGCALAVWNNPALDAADSGVGVSSRWRLSLLVASLGVLMATFVVRSGTFRETIRYSLQGIALTPVFVASVRCPHWWIFRPLNWRPMKFIGTLSYSLYLVHQAVLAAVEQHSRLGAVARGGVALLVSLAISWTMYFLVEKPCAAVRRRLSATVP
jgi:peptidoglycan/LPS O-acetylase OafA/YrhL